MELGSAHDPIFVRGEETTPTDLEGTNWPFEDTTSIRISYFTVRNGKARLLKNGTLSGMVRDRKRKSPPFKSKYRGSPRCPHCKRRM